jgi:membrane-associated HD superfamily phosphohydrolase
MLWEAKFSSDTINDSLRIYSLDRGLKILNTILTRGVIQPIAEIENKPGNFKITLIIQNIAERVQLKDIYNVRSAYETISAMLDESEGVDSELLKQLLEDSILQNVLFNEKVTLAEQNKLLDEISLTHGMIQEGERIISKGDVISTSKFQILESLRREYESKVGGQTHYYLILAGQVLLVSISLTVLVFFLFF